MKKLGTLLLLLLLSLLLCAAAVAECDHSGIATWREDPNNYTNHQLVCEDCGEVINNHAAGEGGLTTCELGCCGGEHYLCTWKQDPNDYTNHQLVCDVCGEILNQHACGKGKDTTCEIECCGDVHNLCTWKQDPDDYYTHQLVCDVCGAVVAEHAIGEGANSTCDLDCCNGEHLQLSWQQDPTDATVHQLVCVCGYVDATHKAGEGKNTPCEVTCCNEEHAEGKWVVRADGMHVKVCPLCGEELTEAHSNGYCYDEEPELGCELDCCGGNHKMGWIKEDAEGEEAHLYTCSKCGYVDSDSLHLKGDSYVTNCPFCHVHWYGAFTSNDADDTHSASCQKDGCDHVLTVACQRVEFVLPGGEEDGSDKPFSLCPVCGHAGEDDEFLPVEGATVTGAPSGTDLLCRSEMMTDKLQVIIVAFEKAGKLVVPDAAVTVTVPAGTLKGSEVSGADAVVNADGSATFTVNIDSNGAAMILVK